MDTNRHFIVRYALFDPKTKLLQYSFAGYIKLYDSAAQAREARVKFHEELRKNGVKQYVLKVVKVRQVTEIIEVLKH